MEATGPGSSVLDAGSGGGDVFPFELRGRVGQMVGVDFDPGVTSNPRLDVGLQASLMDIPLPESSMDVIFSR